MLNLKEIKAQLFKSWLGRDIPFTLEALYFCSTDDSLTLATPFERKETTASDIFEHIQSEYFFVIKHRGGKKAPEFWWLQLIAIGSKSTKIASPAASPSRKSYLSQISSKRSCRGRQLALHGDWAPACADASRRLRILWTL